MNELSEQGTLFDYARLDTVTATTVREKADSIRAAAKRTVETVLEIGRDLTEVKELLGHGQFLGWLEVEFGWSVRTADNIMAAWEAFKFATVANLAPIDLGALYALAAPSTPLEVREAALELAAEGERVTKAQVDAGRRVARQEGTGPTPKSDEIEEEGPEPPEAPLLRAGFDVIFDAIEKDQPATSPQVKRRIRKAMDDARDARDGNGNRPQEPPAKLKIDLSPLATAISDLEVNDLWTYDPADCAATVHPTVRDRILRKARSCRDWLDRFITTVEETERAEVQEKPGREAA